MISLPVAIVMILPYRLRYGLGGYRFTMKKLTGILLAAMMLFGLVACGGEKTENSNGSGSQDVQENSGGTTEISGLHHVEITIQDFGTISVELDADTAPITVANFLKLAEEGFYDGLTFHRIMSGFMIQGGDPQGDGFGGSDENIIGEFAVNGIENNLSHTRGAISMARAKAYNSASSQFFIVHEDSLFLDGQYACFGYVTDGIEVVDAICDAVTPIDDNGTVLAADQPVIESVKVID